MSRDPCTACDEEFEEEDLLLVCSVCLVEHHAACYIANGIKCHACGSSATPIDPEAGKEPVEPASASGVQPASASGTGSAVQPASASGAG
ncbi:MAG: hypothetical protein KDD82_23430, partial [Planctomycetes bacterium]|nr:hypothetical protein [Planctomycetota bacterium]